MLLAVLLSFASTAHANIETFTSGADGWGTSLIDGTAYSWAGPAPTYSPSGGNPGGYISAAAGNNVNSRLYSFDAPSAAFGTLTGQTLTVDLKMSGTVGTVAGASPATARFYIGYDSNDYFVSTNAYSISLSGSGGWVTSTIPLASVNFMAWPGQTGTDTFAYVAANPIYVGLVFTSADFSAANDATSTQGLISAAGATVSLDNFGTVSPTPAGALLLATGLACLAGTKRKRLTGLTRRARLTSRSAVPCSEATLSPSARPVRRENP
jgi:hypothetical protein